MTAKVTVEPFGETLEIEPGESVLSAVLRQGRFLRYGCKHGGCGTCRALLVGGDCQLSEQTSYALSDADRSAGVVLLCSTYADDGVVVVDVSDTMDLTAEEFAAGQVIGEFQAIVDAVEPLTHDMRLLRLSIVGPQALEFTPGQYVEVAVPGSDDEWRSFSMATPAGDSGPLEFVIRVIPGGRFSSCLDRLRPGDPLAFRGPLGQFGVRLSHRPMLMIAGGSGLAPIRSMLATLSSTGNTRAVTFFFGARTDRDLFLLAEFQQFAAQHPWFTFVPALSDSGPPPSA